MSDIQKGLEFQTNEIVKELEALRQHIFFKLASAPYSEKAMLLEYESKVLTALSAL
jgi:hypothetical protein